MTDTIDLKSFFADSPAGAAYYGAVGNSDTSALTAAMHNAAYKDLGLSAVYRNIAVAPEQWKDFIRQALHQNFLDGFNILAPLDENLMADLDLENVRIEGHPVRYCRGMDTVFKSDNGWACDNTTPNAFIEEVKGLGIQYAAKNVVVLGGGRAARAAIYAFRTQTGVVPRRLTVINRTVEKAKAMVQDSGVLLKSNSFPLVVASTPKEQEQALKEASLLINASAVGEMPGDPPIPLEWLHPTQNPTLKIFDLVAQRETELRQFAKAKDLESHDGLGMAVRRAAKTFQIWFNRPAPVDVMRQAAEAVLATTGGSPR